MAAGRSKNIYYRVPEILYEAWRVYGDAREITSIVEVSALVSTNQVFRLSLGDGTNVIAKVSSYGSYFQFREDHQRVHQWFQLLQDGPYDGFLSDSLLKNDDVYTYYDGAVWVIFYNDISIRSYLPRILAEQQIVELGRQMARFHSTCAEVAKRLPPSAKSIKSDIIFLFDLLSDRHHARKFRMRTWQMDLLRYHCHTFLENLERLGYENWTKIPVLIDWNLGNFSVEFGERESFRLFSRWDYDWFRIDPSGLDFYFLSRVCSSVGDRTVFSYLVDPLLEPRFQLFVRAYHALRPLQREDLLFFKEAYRFFILNYVIKDGDHFFQPEIISRLKQEALDRYLPEIDQVDFGPLLRSLD
ncbi:MAG: hypothetical protein H7A21_03080 [Spirochaetales bacterium]|nr:hypothetical protein [Leptospiraceae bacterium]MCP5480392.1 hypothetical protein [Spirochaetales bacterium]